MRSLLVRQQVWQVTEVTGTQVAEVITQEWSWTRARRVVLVRHFLEEKKRPGGKRLIETPGYSYQVLITSLASTVPAIEVSALRYNGRAGCECVIKELDAHYGLPQLCLKQFWATEAALSLAIVSYNLCMLFQQAPGMDGAGKCRHAAFSALYHRRHCQSDGRLDHNPAGRFTESKGLGGVSIQELNIGLIQ